MCSKITNGVILVLSITNLHCGDDGSGTGNTLDVVITTPTQTVYTRADVTIQVAVSGGVADRLELIRDGEILVTLAPPYQYTWNTTGDDEGAHELVARAYQGGHSVDSEARMVVVDRTPPTIAERSPLPGADEVWVRAAIRATFSEPVLATTVGDDVLTMWHDTGMLPSSHALSVDGLTLTITPIETPEAPDTLSVEWHAGITDLAGNELDLPADNWTFSMPTWLHVGPALDSMSLPGTNAYRPLLRLDAAGTPVVAWSEDLPGSGATIQVARWDGAFWSAFAQMDAAPAATPSMSLDATGTPVLAWSKYDVTEYDVRVEHWNGSSWAPVGTELGAYQLAYGPSLATSSDGTLVAWYEYSTPDSVENVYVSRFNGVTWDPLGVRVSANSSAGSHARYPSLAVGPLDRILLAWSELVSGEFDVYVAEWVGDATPWPLLGTPQDAVAGQNAIEPVVGWSGAYPIVAWTEGDAIHVRSFVDGGWTALGGALGDGDGARQARTPTLATDTDGSTLVAWSEWSSGGSETHVQRFTGTDWAPVGEGGITPPEGFANHPVLAVSPAGDLYLAFDDEGVAAADSVATVLRLNR